MKKRKTILYMDFSYVEEGSNLSQLEQLTHERLSTSKDWDRLIFWMDMEAALGLLSDYESRCFVLNLIEGYAEAEIAARLKIGQQMVSRKIKKAKIKIRNYLKEGYNAP